MGIRVVPCAPRTNGIKTADRPSIPNKTPTVTGSPSGPNRSMAVPAIEGPMIPPIPHIRPNAEFPASRSVPENRSPSSTMATVYVPNATAPQTNSMGHIHKEPSIHQARNTHPATVPKAR